MKITFLGTGTSNGVPHVDCMLNDYNNCRQEICRDSAENSKHRRTRSSVLLETNGKSILIDTSMDFRFQMLRSKVKRVDAVLFTHSHADHIFGLPDIRSYTMRQREAINIFGSEETISNIKKYFEFIFNPPAFHGGGIARLTPNVVSNKFYFHDIEIIPVPVSHGILKGCFGYRINGTAYLPDVKEIPESSMKLLKGLDVLILNALRKTPHPTHLSLKESVSIAELLMPQRCFLIHLNHDIHYMEEENKLPDYIRFSYDTLQVVI